MENEKEETNRGCLLIVAVFVIANLFYLFSSDNKETVTNTGTLLLVFAVIGGVGYCLSKLTKKSPDNTPDEHTAGDGDNSVASPDGKKNPEPKKGYGCLIGGIVTIAALAGLGVIINNTEIAYVVGAVFAIALVIGIGIYMYNAGND